MEIVKTKITSSKGSLAAVIHYPEIKTERLAILLPGHLDSKDYKHLVYLAEALSKQGYTVVRFDPTGTWQSEGEIYDYTTTQCLEDIKNVLEYMLRNGNYSHILLGGHSRGGFVSMLYAVRDQRISIVLGIMSPYSLIRTVNKDKIDKWKQEGFRISLRDIQGTSEKREFRIPYSDMEDAQKYNVLEVVEELHNPLILVAGELDDVIPPEDVKLIFDKANEPKKLIVIKDIGHDYRYNDDEINIVNERILDQLAKLKDHKFNK